MYSLHDIYVSEQVSVFELRMVGGEGEVVLEEVVSRSNVFVSGAEVEWQVISIYIYICIYIYIYIYVYI